MAYLLAVLAAFSNAMTTILQRLGVENAPAESTLKLSLLTYALKRKVWIAGFIVLIGGFLFQFTALHFGRLTLVQPVLTLELPFLVAILGFWFRHPLGWWEWAGALAAAGGLSAFLAVSQPGGGSLQPSDGDWIIAGLGCLAGAAVAVLLTRIGSSAFKAAMFGVASAVAYAFTAAVIKAMNIQITAGWGTVFTHWPPYVLAATGLAGVFLAQNAFHAGPVTSSQATLVITDPLVSILLGVWLFGDRLATGGYRKPVEFASLVVLFAGVYALARSPLVAGVKSEEGDDLHLLSGRSRSRWRSGGGDSGTGAGTSARPPHASTELCQG